MHTLISTACFYLRTLFQRIDNTTHVLTPGLNEIRSFVTSILEVWWSLVYFPSLTLLSSLPYPPLIPPLSSSHPSLTLLSSLPYPPLIPPLSSSHPSLILFSSLPYPPLIPPLPSSHPSLILLSSSLILFSSLPYPLLIPPLPSSHPSLTLLSSLPYPPLIPPLSSSHPSLILFSSLPYPPLIPPLSSSHPSLILLSPLPFPFQETLPCDIIYKQCSCCTSVVWSCDGAEWLLTSLWTGENKIQHKSISSNICHPFNFLDSIHFLISICTKCNVPGTQSTPSSAS